MTITTALLIVPAVAGGIFLGIFLRNRARWLVGYFMGTAAGGSSEGTGDHGSHYGGGDHGSDGGGGGDG